MPNNCILLEFKKENLDELDEVAQGAHLAVDLRFNALILCSTEYRFGYRSSIDVWVTEDDLNNAPMMLLLAYIIVGHSEWKRASIRLFACSETRNAEREADRLSALMTEGRLPISRQNVTSVSYSNKEDLAQAVAHHSCETDLVIAGLTAGNLNSEGLAQTLHPYEAANDILFVHATEQIAIDS